MIKALYGYGGHAREVAAQIGEEVVFFVDDEWVNEFTKPISLFDVDKYQIMIAVSNNNDREEIVKRLPKETKYFTFIHPTAIILNDVEIGEGSFIGINSVITCNIKIGKHSILNRGNQIGHDSIIGDYFSAMPGSIVSGNVTIGNKVYLGTNSSIREKLSICSNVTIGLNTGLVKNIDSPGTYVGSLLKKIN
jgi:sugar O-acyltransferase (sialic acid O-acetyltransferase NeuD family)